MSSNTTEAELREQARAIYGDKFIQMVERLSEMTPEQRSRALGAIGHHGGARAIGQWGNDLTVFIDGESFRVTPGADRILIRTSSDKAWAHAYAADTQQLLYALRATHFGDQTILHKLQESGRSTLATIVMESLIESKTARAMVGVGGYAGSGGAG